VCSKLRTKLLTASPLDDVAATLAQMATRTKQHTNAFRSFHETTLRLFPEGSFLTIFDQLVDSLAWQVGPGPLQTILELYLAKDDAERKYEQSRVDEQHSPYRTMCLDSELASLEQKPYSTTWVCHYLWNVYNTTTELDPMANHWLRTSGRLRSALDAWVVCLLSMFQDAKIAQQTIHVGLRAMILAIS
jgi:hypothetical protein